MTDFHALFNDLIRFEIELSNTIDTRLRADFNLPLTYYEPMTVIDRTPRCRVYDIAAELLITTGGASKLVDRIESSGYCRRLPNPADRRSSLLELTARGQRLLTDATTAFDRELQHRLATALPERTLRQFAAALSHLRTSTPRITIEEVGETA
jgi:MarR family transcriptional regulator, organic hydroperoxide resistance regulator